MSEKPKATAAAQLTGKPHLLMSVFSYLVVGSLILYFQKIDRGLLNTRLLFNLVSIAFVANLAFYLAVARGMEKMPDIRRFSLVQAAAAALPVIILAYTNIDAKGIILTAYIVVFLFGALRLGTGGFAALAIFAAAGHGLVILFFALLPGERPDIKTELLYWAAMLSTLPCFAILCKEVNDLRNKSRTKSKKLQTAEHRYKGLHDNMTDPAVVIDRNGRIVTANPAFVSAVGASGAKLDGEAVVSFLPPYEIPVIENLLSSEAASPMGPFFLNILGPGGEKREMECKASTIEEPRGNRYLLLNLRDISNRRRLEKRLEESWEELEQTKVFTILGLAKLTEFRDKNTGDHLGRICGYTRILARQLSSCPKYRDHITERYIKDIELSAALHDIGKVGLPDEILLKPGALSDREFEVVKQHSLIGGEAIEKTESFIRGESFLTLGRLIAYYHHERWDGSGYPFGLCGEEIPLCARIVGLADVYDALTTKRIYKDPVSHERAKSIITAERGKQFDPDVVDAFLAAESQIKALIAKTG